MKTRLKSFWRCFAPWAPLTLVISIALGMTITVGVAIEDIEERRRQRDARIEGSYQCANHNNKRYFVSYEKQEDGRWKIDDVDRGVIYNRNKCEFMYEDEKQ